MKFGGICIETDDAPRLAEFYKIIFGEEPFIEGSHYGFGSIAVYDPGGVIVAKDKNICLQCFVEDLDAEYEGFFLSFADYTPIGDAHVALRSEYVNGTELGGTSGYLEAIYVRPEYRKNGVATTLVRLCESWAKERGCREFASDCLSHNTDSYLFHLRLGFTETERCIFFRKDIK